MRIIYRISDQSFNKPRVPGATKKRCLANFLNIFGGCDNITIIADNCEESLPFIKQADRPYEETHFGNSKSFIHAVEKALDFKENIVYFVEDDYYHRQDAPQLITEGLKVGDYITLYDHPDKYTKIYYY